MKQIFNHPIFKNIEKYKDAIVAALILMIVILIMVPLPSFLLDALLSLNIAFAVLVLLMAIFSKKVLDFAIFPTLLLVTTLFRLGLNVSSTRLILSTGDPGEVVTSFGEFVTKGNMVVGSVIFIIIVIVQFLVITNGSTRVAEVSARFALDAMPGKQMAIDNELNNGTISEIEAKKRRQEVQLEAEFFGAMDGASKFVKGDAIAGIIVVLINFIGGIVIFMMKGYEAMDAIQKFGSLTIGDGLVSQIPALLISVASGILVTRTPSDDNLGVQFVEQFGSIPKAILMGAITMVILGFVPGLPFIPFVGIGVVLGIAAYLLYEGEKQEYVMADSAPSEPVEPQSPLVDKNSMEHLSNFLEVRPLEIQIGLGLLPLVQNRREQEFLERVSNLREQLVSELGLLVPGIPLEDNLQLGYNEYRILVKGVSVATGEIYPNDLLVMNPYGSDITIDGVAVKEPAFGLDAKWISNNHKSEAEQLGYTIVDDLTVLMMHLKEVIKKESPELLSRQELKKMLDVLKETDSSLVEDVIPNILSLGEVLNVLKALLREQVSIRDLGTILEVIANYAPQQRETHFLVERVRMGLSRRLVLPYLNSSGGLDALVLKESTTDLLLNQRRTTDQGDMIVLSQPQLFSLFQAIQGKVDAAMVQQKDPVLIVHAKLRSSLRQLLETTFPNLAILSFMEIPNYIKFDVVGSVDMNE